MTSEPSPGTNLDRETLLESLMRRQRRLSLCCASAFLVLLLGLPLANYFYPDLMATRVVGFTLSWLILGVLFFPFVWIIAYVFIRKSMDLEEEEFREFTAKTVPKAGAEPPTAP